MVDIYTVGYFPEKYGLDNKYLLGDPNSLTKLHSKVTWKSLYNGFWYNIQ